MDFVSGLAEVAEVLAEVVSDFGALVWVAGVSVRGQ